MSPPGQREQELADAFAAWEVWGRGWLQAPEPVALEPPLLFPGWHRHPGKAQDDTRRAHWLKRLFLSKEPVEEKPEPEVTLKQALPAWDLVEQVILPLADHRFSPALSIAFLSSLTALKSPIAFEIVGKAGFSEIRLAYSPSDHALVSSALSSASPRLICEPAEPLAKLWQHDRERFTAGFEFALSREFVLPLPDPGRDLILALLCAFHELERGEQALWQVLLQPTARNWPGVIQAALMSPTGHPLFADAPELSKAAEEKIRYPLMAATVRLLVSSESEDRPFEIAQAVMGALAGMNSSAGNALLPLSDTDTEALEQDILARVSRRLGMVLSVRELSALVSLPHDARIAPGLRLYSAAPRSPHRGEGITIGRSEGIVVRLSTEDRLRHVHVIGASGTGKSNLLLSMMLQDAREGRGLGLVDPHGDLADALLERIPGERQGDVVVIDPTDAERVVGWNVLSASREAERELLASDLVGVFRRLSTSWGDQMTSVLSNAVLVFLSAPEGGTLVELRRFLLEENYRARYLKGVDDPYLRSFWEQEFSLLAGRRPQAPILTRLDTLLRNQLVRGVLTLQKGALDFRALLDQNRILVARLAQGRIGAHNASLLGSMLVSRIQQAAITRTDTGVSSRELFFLYLDEFHEVATPSMATLFSGIRKYGVGLTVAHHDLSQLIRSDTEVERALLTNAHVRVAFRVGEEDARKLGSGFAHFESQDLTSLPIGHAIARIGGAEGDFRLHTPLVESVGKEEAVARRLQVEAMSRERYGVKRPERRGAHEPVEPEPVITGPAPVITGPAPHPEEAPSKPSKKKEGERPVDRAIPVSGTSREHTVALPEHPEGRGGPEHRYLQALVRSWAQERGFKAELEVELPLGGRVDLVITPPSKTASTIAVEISVSTGIEHEIGNAEKCVEAGFTSVAMLSTDRRFRAELHRALQTLSEAHRQHVQVYAPDEFLLFLQAIPLAESQVAGYTVTTTNASDAEDARVRRERLNSVIASSLARLRK